MTVSEFQRPGSEEDTFPFGPDLLVSSEARHRVVVSPTLFEVSVLLHAAARDARAESAGRTGLLRARALEERCRLLLRARDASTVLTQAWPELLAATGGLPIEERCSLLHRVSPEVAALRVEHRLALALVPREGPSGDGYDAYLTAFPGDAMGWLCASLDATRENETLRAADALDRCRRLEPSFTGEDFAPRSLFFAVDP